MKMCDSRTCQFQRLVVQHPTLWLCPLPASIPRLVRRKPPCSLLLHGANGCTLSRRSSSSRVCSILPWHCPRQVKVWQVPSPADPCLRPRRLVGASGGVDGPPVKVVLEISVFKNLFLRQIFRHLGSETCRSSSLLGCSPVSLKADTGGMKGGRKM
jgi:hypothetical protein